MSDFDKNYPNARSKTGKPGWPSGVRSISTEGLDYVGVDNEGRLYWDGKRLVTQELKLTPNQTTAALIGVVAAVAVATVEWLRFLGYGTQ